MSTQEKPPIQATEIIFEGIGGSGKTVQLATLAHQLTGVQIPTLITPSPRIDALESSFFPPEVLRAYPVLAQAMIATFLKICEKNELEKEIEKLNKQGQPPPVILRDGWLASILAHNFNFFNTFNRRTIESWWRIFGLRLNPKRGATLLFDLDPSIAHERQQKNPKDRADANTGLEQANLVRMSYLALQKRYENQWRVLNAAQKSADLNKQVLQVAQEIIHIK